jgi:hypothetical protein
MSRLRIAFSMALFAAALGAPVSAQQRPTRGETRPQAQRLGERARQATPAERIRMERNIRQALWRATQRRTGLNDAQMGRLDGVTRRLEPQRAALLRREGEARRGLRAELALAQPDQARVSKFMDELQGIQRERLDLATEEQRHLSAFMSPVQRARYFALREQFRRRLEQVRRGAVEPGIDTLDERPLRRRRQQLP